jgi:hypothetical protein
VILFDPDDGFRPPNLFLVILRCCPYRHYIASDKWGNKLQRILKEMPKRIKDRPCSGRYSNRTPTEYKSNAVSLDQRVRCSSNSFWSAIMFFLEWIIMYCLSFNLNLLSSSILLSTDFRFPFSARMSDKSFRHLQSVCHSVFQFFLGDGARCVSALVWRADVCISPCHWLRLAERGQMLFSGELTRLNAHTLHK